jgi:hypothetical protein
MERFEVKLNKYVQKKSDANVEIEISREPKKRFFSMENQYANCHETFSESENDAFIAHI